MKTAIFLFFLLVMYATVAKAQTPPPVSIKGQSSTTKLLPKWNIQVPNKQATNLGGIDALIETGNTNILENPSFEHSTATTGWSSAVTGTATNTLTAGSNSTNELGAKRLNFSCAGGASGGTCTISQDQNTSKTVQGLALAYISTNTPSGVKLKPRANGAEISGLEVSAQTTSEFLYKVPFTLGSSSSGLEVEITVSAGATITGTVDAAFVGAVDLKADTNNVGNWISFTPTGGWSTNTTYAGRWRQVGENAEYEVSVTLSGAPTGDFSLNLPSGHIIDTTKLPLATNRFKLGEATAYINAGGGNGRLLAEIFYNSTTVVAMGVLPVASGSAHYMVGVNATSPVTWASGDVISIKFKVPLTIFSSSGSVYTSTNADTDWAACNFSTLSWNGLGTVTSSLECKRQGSDLLMRGSFVPGTTSANEARIPLPVWNGVQLTNSKDGYVGDTFRNVAGANSNRDYIGLVTSGQAYVKIGIREYASTAASLTVQNGSALVNSGETMPVEFRIPISGWTQSNLIIGQFNELMVTPNVSKPKTCYYAFGGASATLASPTECTTGTCTEVVDTCGTASPPTFSSTGVYTDLTFASGTFANSSYIKCSCIAYDTGIDSARKCQNYFTTNDQTWQTNSSGGYVMQVFIQDTGTTPQNGYAQVECVGQAP